jgi:acetyl-CoA synthetase
MVADEWREFVQRFRHGAHQDYSEHWQLFQSLAASAPDAAGPMPVWWPGKREVQSSNLAALLRETDLDDYRQLHRWSVDHREDFWRAVIERLEIDLPRPAERVLDLSAGVEHPGWLTGARYNIVDSCFQASPDAAAIIHASEDDPQPRTLSYGDLRSRVCRVANGLRENGFGEDQALVLYMPMTADCVAAYLGVIHAGCRVVSVADSFSAVELRKRIEIANAAAVITLASYSWAGRRIDLYQKVRQALADLDRTVRCVVIPAADDEDLQLADGDLLWGNFLGSTAIAECVLGPPDRVTNVLFSSGTTGAPKAIPWTQLTPIKCAMDAHFHQDVQSGDVVAWPTNIGWMMGPWLIYAALINRAAMALFQGAPHSAGFVRFVETSRVTMCGLVPALVRAWRSRNLVAPNTWNSIRVFSSTGEVSNPEDYLWLMSRAGYRAPVIEYLGGTEIGGGHATGSVLLPASPSTFSTAALGIDFVILDEQGRPTGRGELGELFLIPPAIGLSQTLLNKDHHEIYYAGCPAGREDEVLRRHGDEFIELDNGYYKAQGRTDDTMNLGGIKVSSIELEEVINEHPAVFESAAVAVQLRGTGAESLVIYAVLADNRALQSVAPELSHRIATELNPLFKIHEVVPIDALPRTASNKVMRRELRNLYWRSRRKND